MRLAAVISAWLCVGCAAPWDDCLIIPTETIDFGEVPLSTSARETITIRNPRTSPRMVTVEPNLAPFGPAAENVLVLLAGGQKTVELNYFPRDSRLHLGEAVVREEDPACEPKRIPLRGFGAGQMMVLEPPAFPPTALGSSATRDLILFSSRRSTVNATLIFDATLAAPAGTWSGPENVRLEPSIATRVPVTFSPRLEGVWMGSVDVIASSGPAQRGEVLRVPLEGIVGVPRLQLSRSALRLSAAPIGSTIQRHLYVRNAGTGRLVWRVQVKAGPNTQAGELAVPSPGPFELEAGQQHVLPLMIVPAAAGHRQWTLELLTNDVQQPVVAVPITAEASDVLPCGASVVASQSPLVTAGPFPRAVTLTLSNPNASPCLVSAMEFDAFTDWSLSLPPDDDTFVIDANAMASQTITIPSSGTRFVRWRTWGAGASEVMIVAN